MYSIVVFAFLLSVVACGAIGGWLVVRHDADRPAFAFGLFMLLMAFWSATHVGTLSATTEGWLLRFSQLSYVSVTLAPVVWLVFALRYRSRGDAVTGRRLAALLVVPVATLAVVFTAEFHTLLYASTTVEQVAGQPHLATTSGGWHSVNVVYSYSLLLAGTGLLAGAAVRDNRLYRRQTAVLLACVCLPWLVNAAYHVGVRPVPWVDPTPLAFTVVGTPLAAVVVRTDLASFLPVAHERVFRTFADPVVVATPAGRVIDSNGAARAVLGDGDPLEGRPVEAVLPDALTAGGSLHPELDDVRECSIARDGEQRHYVARRRYIDPADHGPDRGYLVSLTDVTVQKDQQRALEAKTERLQAQADRLEQKNEQLERLADIVSHDLGAPLSTAESLLVLLRGDLSDPAPEVDQSLSDLESVHERLRAFADHLPELARESTDVETTEACDLASVARSAWIVVETGDVELTVEGTRAVAADRRRLQQVFENLFRNAIEHGTPDDLSASAPEDASPHRSRAGIGGPGAGRAPDGVIHGARANTAGRADVDRSSLGQQADRVTVVRVGATPTGFYVADDGPGVPLDLREEVFTYGTSTGAGSGFGLAIVRTIVQAHGWTVDLRDAGGGARFEVETDT